jgi:hypothetical protein
MTDPIETAGEWHVYTVEELRAMNALDYVRAVSKKIDDPALTFPEAVRIARRRTQANAWDEGWAARRDTEEPTDGIPSFPLNPYRSES